MVNTLCIVQARLTSSRLPNKVLMTLGASGLSILEHVYQRLSMSKHIDKVIFAIPETESNDKLAIFLNTHNIDYIRGSEENVLERFYDCSIKYKPEIIVRATCDNPCVDWKEIDMLIENLPGNDYISSMDAPLGSSAEVFYSQALYVSHKNANSDVEREHVTPYIYRHPNVFKCTKKPYRVPKVKDYRLTVDTEQDFMVVDKIYSALYEGRPIPNELIYSFIGSHDEIRSINESIEQKKI